MTLSSRRRGFARALASGSRIASLAIVASLLACPPIVNPDKPKLPAAAPWPAIEDSSIVLPVSIPVEMLRSAIDQNVPRGWAEWDAWIHVDHACLRYKVERRDVQMGVNGGHVAINVPGHFWFRGCLSPNNHACVPCGSCDAELGLPVSGDFSLVPDWRIEGALHNDGIRINDCKIGFFNYNINGKVADVSNPKIDQAIGRANQQLSAYTSFKAKGQALWTQSFAPIKVGEKAWLSLNPQSVLASQINGASGSIGTAVGLVARPILTFGPQPAPAPVPALPALKLVAPSNAFHIALDGLLNFDAASAELRARLVNRKYQFDKNWIRITDASVYGAGSQVVIQLSVDEALRGTLYLVGTPRYDVNRDVLMVDQLDYSIETRNILVKVADWIFHQRWQDSLAQQAHWSLAQPLGRAREDVAAALNKKYGAVQLTGSLAALRILGVSADERELVVRGVADGTVQADVAAVTAGR